MKRRLLEPRPALLASLTVAGIALVPSSASADHGGPLDGYKHIVVIYEENHSFDNLYGSWGDVNGQHVIGLGDATDANTTQVDQAGTPYPCLLMSDVNLMSPPLSPDCSTTTFSFGAGKPTTAYHFGNAPFNIDAVHSGDGDDLSRCRPNCSPTRSACSTAAGLPGGCTRDLVHRFYQEQYQLNGGQQNRYVTGSDSAGMTMGYYDTTQLPIYKYLHCARRPNYVVADQFFQAAFGGSFLNHQYLVAAAAAGRSPPALALGARRQRIPQRDVSALHDDGRHAMEQTPRPAACRRRSPASPAATSRSTRCSRRTSQPARSAPRCRSSTTRRRRLTIGDRLTDAKVSWAWYAGGWDNANGNVDGRGYTNGARPDLRRSRTRHRPRPTSPASAATRTARICRSSPTTSRSTTSRATRRAARSSRTCRTRRTSSTPRRPASCRRSASSSRSATRTSTPATPASRTAATTSST